jgi:hypothetical protein
MEKFKINIKNKFFNFILLIIVNIIFSSYSFCMDEDLGDLRRLEGFLNKNKSSMEKLGRGKYRVSDEQFDIIFPACHFSLGTNDINTSVGLIENEFNDILSGNTSISVGTGTIIKNDLDDILVITAKHVVEKKGIITFTLGSSLMMPGNNGINYLAKYEADKVFFHNSKDVAYCKFNLKERILDENKLRLIKMERSHTPVNSKKSVTIYHYPFGIEIQRLNKGFIFSNNDNHTIPTLGGSSGAPIILDGKIIGIHSGAHEFEGGETEFRGEKLDFSKHNYYVRMSNVMEDLSDFTERN